MIHTFKRDGGVIFTEANTGSTKISAAKSRRARTRWIGWSAHLFLNTKADPYPEGTTKRVGVAEPRKWNNWGTNTAIVQWGPFTAVEEGNVNLGIVVPGQAFAMGTRRGDGDVYFSEQPLRFFGVVTEITEDTLTAYECGGMKEAVFWAEAYRLNDEDHHREFTEATWNNSLVQSLAALVAAYGTGAIDVALDWLKENSK